MTVNTEGLPHSANHWCHLRKERADYSFARRYPKSLTTAGTRCFGQMNPRLSFTRMLDKVWRKKGMTHAPKHTALFIKNG